MPSPYTLLLILGVILSVLATLTSTNNVERNLFIVVSVVYCIALIVTAILE